MMKPGSSLSELGLIREEEEEPIIYNKIYVAVGKDFKENMLNLTWALHSCGVKEICIFHVLAPSEMNHSGGKPSRNQWGRQEVMADEEKERKEVAKALETYTDHCHKTGNRVQTLCIEADSIVNGIITLVSQKRIGRLVMGAAAENKFRKNMKDLKSEKAMTVYLQAPTFCQIWFVCKGTLVCTRPGVKPESSLSRSSSVSASDITRDKSTPRKSQASSDESDHFSRLGRSKSAQSPQPTSEVASGPSPSRSVQYEIIESETRNMNTALFDQLYNVLTRADHLKTEVIDAIHKGEEMQNLFREERMRREELVEDLNKKIEELQLISSRKSSLQKEMEIYKKERDELARELENALSETKGLRNQIAQMNPTSSHASEFFADFSRSEIAEATCNFDLSLKIGEGGYGNTYKGFLCYTEVAIKVPKPDSSQGVQEFNQEVEVLSRLRHPNIVTLIGVCSEASALIYEYVPNGSLEDRLSRKNNSTPLSWQVRTQIARELCNVLIFLQSSKPKSIVHGDLKPANILLDSNLKCKLSDFGICRGIKSMSNNVTVLHLTTPKGTFPYMDPSFLSTGELTAKSDVYSYGIVLLRMLTGKPAMNIRNEVNSRKLSDVLDSSAGEWPIEQTTWLAELAMRCCEVNRRDRPDIATVWKALNRRGSSNST